MNDTSKLSKEQLSTLRNQLRSLSSQERAPSTQKSALEAKSREQDIPDLSVIFFSGLSEGKDPYRLMLDIVRFVDAQNFKAVWVPERHFTEAGGAYPNPSVIAAALSTITENVRLRAGSINLPLHDPLRVAEEWAVIDNLSDGRVDLSVAPGWHVRDFVLKPENFDIRAELMNEYRQQLASLWSGQAHTRADANGDTHSIVTYPRPVQTNLPLWLTTSQNEDAWRFAGESGLNVLTALINFGPKELEKRIQLYRKARSDAGYEPSEGVVSLMLHTYVDESNDVAIKKVHKPLTDYLASFVTQHQTANTRGDSKVNTLNAIEGERDEFVEMVFNRYVTTSSLIGSPEHVGRILESFKKMGVDEIACLVDFGVDALNTLSSLKLLATLIPENQS